MRLAYITTPLLLRTGNGYEGVVKLLLTKKEADFEITDKKGGTLLSLAAELGQEGVIELPVVREASTSTVETMLTEHHSLLGC